MATTLTDEQAKLLTEGRNFATVATIREDGTPHATPIWVDWDGERVVLNTAIGRAKERHLRRDPRVSVVVYDHENPYRYVEISGRAEFDEDSEAAWAHIDSLNRKYNGSGDYPRGGPERVVLRIAPERVGTMGFDQ